MTETTTTHFSNKCAILADLWMSYRNDSEFSDFIEYNDIGLPLAYLLDNHIVETSDMARKFVEETFDLFLAGLDIEDTGFEILEEILTVSEKA